MIWKRYILKCIVLWEKMYSSTFIVVVLDTIYNKKEAYFNVYKVW
jgi:hypothetical protein